MTPRPLRPFPITALMRDRRGATAVEYALILAMIVLTMVGALSMTATSTTALWTMVSNRIETAK